MIDELTAFLNARYDEAEALAKAAAAHLRVHNPERWYEADDDRFAYPEDAAFIAANDPAHRLRDIALKRAILADCRRCLDSISWGHRAVFIERVVRQFGTEFSDHPDYRQEWKP